MPLPDDDPGFNAEGRHNGTDLLRFRLRRAYDLQMIEFLRIADRTGCQKCPSKKRPAAAWILHHHVSYYGKVFAYLSLL